jgi:hypothetical protein
MANLEADDESKYLAENKCGSHPVKHLLSWMFPVILLGTPTRHTHPDFARLEFNLAG